MMKETTSGIGFAGLLTVAFIVLKLTDVIGWSWWWVLSPIWMPAAFILVVFLGVMLLGVQNALKRR